MFLSRVLLITAVGVGGVTAPVLAQSGATGQGIESLTSTRESLLVSYEEGATVTVQLEGTQRLPTGEGRAEVRRRPGVTELDRVRLNKMKPATLFGGDFSTYVTRTVSPEGLAVNVGEFILDGEKSELRVTSPFDMFGLFITAEPHALVRMPSRFVVLDNTGAGVRRGRTTTRSIEYRGFDGVYEFERESLIRQQRTRGKQRVERQQAASAIALAERAGAATYAPAELRAAAGAHARMAAAFDRGASQAELVLLAHETVRLAVRAEDVAKTEAAAASLAAERQAAQAEIDILTQARTEATRATQLAQEAAARLEALRIQAQQEAEEARTEALRYAQLRDEANTQAERDRLAAEEARVAQQEALRAQAAAEGATRQAQLEQQAARELAELSRQEAERLSALRAEAQSEAERARRDADEARSRMEQALGLIAETRDTARGLIVNLPDILFNFNQATLRPEAREVLSRISGVLLVAPAYTLSIEGHTDAVGSDEYNQQLSERRAASVRDYMVEAQVRPSLMRTQGFGKTRPVASNDTAQGRQTNRRVEIVVEHAEAPAAG